VITSAQRGRCDVAIRAQRAAIADALRLRAACDALEAATEDTIEEREAAFDAAQKAAVLSQAHRVGLVFGREESGLTDVELRRCHDLTTVPSGAEHPALNLSQAVMLYSYEIFAASLGKVPEPIRKLATVHEVESLIKHLGLSLGEIGFRPHQGDPDSFLRSLRRVLARAPLEKRDVNVLHRICQQIDYYVQTHGGPRT
jgi:TrmH family RNA methyltransferase